MIKKKSSKKTQKKNQQSDTPTLSKKEQAAQKRKAAQERQEFISFTSTVFFIAGLISLFGMAVGGPKAAGGAFVGIMSLSLSYKYPRHALWAFLIYMPFAGTVTYAIGGGNALFQLAKDAFYIPALIALAQQCSRKKLPLVIPKAFKTPLLLLLFSSLLTLLIVNIPQQLSPKPGEIPLAMGILGFKVFMGYIPLITCAYYLIRDQKDLLFATRLHVILALICFALCFTQYMFLETGRCEGTRFAEGADLFKASLEARCLVGGSLLYSPSQGVIRLPGTFVAPWQWGWFMISNAYLVFGTAFSDPSFVWRVIGLIAIAGDFVVAVISGQRIALALVPVSFVILLVLTGQVANLKRFIPVALGLGFILVVAAVMYPDVVQERVDSFFNRWEESPADEFIFAQFGFTWKKLKGSMIGLGLGRATNSARVYGDIALIETWFPKVMHEVGPIGLLAFLSVVTALTVMTFKAYRSLKNLSLRSYGASFWVFILFISYQTYYYPLDVDPVAVYYWFFAGVILKLPDIERQEKDKLAATLLNQQENNKKKQRLSKFKSA